MAKRSLQVQKQYKQQVDKAFVSLGLTQKDFAVRLDLSRATVSNFLRGKSINRENFINICHSLKLNWQEITGLKRLSEDSNSPPLILLNPPLKGRLSTSQNALVTQLREQVKADIKTRCGTMRILDMSQPVGLEDIYTKVNILEKISGRARKNITDLISNCDLENFNRFNFGEVTEKISGKDAVRKYKTLFILGKPGAGKTTIRNLPGANTDEAALKLDSEAVLKSLESQHGLLVERAKHIYSFSHLSFQE